MIRRTFRALTALALAATTVALVSPAAPAQAITSTSKEGFHLVIGDGVAAGYNPQYKTAYADRGVGGLTTKFIQQSQPNVKAVYLGCEGETTKTFLYGGGPCEYEAGSQYKQAIKFLKANSGKVRFITINLGGEDVHKCINLTTGENDQLCVIGATAQVGANMPIVFAGLRVHAFWSRIVVNNYYVPYVAASITGGEEGMKSAKTVLGLFEVMNGKLAVDAGLSGVKVADLFKAFDSKNFELTQSFLGTIPTNAANICKYTWTCVQKYNSIMPTRWAGEPLIASRITPLF